MTLMSLLSPRMLLTTAEVAERLRVSVRTAQRLIAPEQNDGIRGIRVGRQLRVDEEDLDRYIQGRKLRAIQRRLPFSR